MPTYPKTAGLPGDPRLRRELTRRPPNNRRTRRAIGLYRGVLRSQVARRMMRSARRIEEWSK